MESRLPRNIAASVLQFVVLGAILVFLYRAIIATAGLGALGVWSLVLASTSISRVANFGMAGSLVRFVAKYAARSEPAKVREAIDTAVLASAVTMAVLLALLYPVLNSALSLVLDSSELPLGRQLLPFALVAAWVQTVQGTLLAGVDGLERVDVRSSILVLSGAFFLVAGLLLIGPYGLPGIAAAQIAQYVFSALAARWFLGRSGAVRVWRLGFSLRAFREMFSDGVHFQLIGVAQLLYEPLTKWLLGSIAGIDSVGLFELASRLVMQLRSLVLSVGPAILPTLAVLEEDDPRRAKTLTVRTLTGVAFATAALFGSLAVSVPLVGQVWVQGSELATLDLFVATLSIGWLVNSLSSAFYSYNIVSGHLGSNSMNHLALVPLNVALSWLLSKPLDGYGVVLGWSLTLVFGGIALAVGAVYRWPSSGRPVMNRTEARFVVAALALFASIAATRYATADIYLRIGLRAFLYLILIATLATSTTGTAIRSKFATQICQAVRCAPKARAR